MAGAPFSENLYCASDAPYGRQTWNFGGFRCMFNSMLDGVEHTDQRVRANPNMFNEKVIQNYMGGNFAKLVIQSCIGIVSINGS